MHSREAFLVDCDQVLVSVRLRDQAFDALVALIANLERRVDKTRIVLEHLVLLQVCQFQRLCYRARHLLLGRGIELLLLAHVCHLTIHVLEEPLLALVLAPQKQEPAGIFLVVVVQFDDLVDRELVIGRLLLCAGFALRPCF